MISNLCISDFKCLHKAELALTRLNVITGKNSSDKSSVIQAINLMSDHLLSKPASGQKTKLIAGARQIRPYSDYKNLYVKADYFELSVATAKEYQYLMRFTPVDARQSGTNVDFTETGGATGAFPNIYHLPASRQSNLDEYKMNGDDRLPLGKEGEMVINFFYNHKEGEVSAMFATTDDKRLQYNLDYWLKELTGYSLKVVPDNERYKVSFIDELGNEIRP